VAIPRPFVPFRCSCIACNKYSGLLGVDAQEAEPGRGDPDAAGRRVRCRRCKQKVSARGLAGHVGGGRCIVDAFTARMSRRGYVPVTWPMTETLRHARVAMEYGPYKFKRGFRAQKSEIKCAHWAPTRAIHEIQALVDAGLPMPTIRALFRSGDREQIEGYITIAALADQ
jgi:hypothetical protein